jgi:hypothetical protein
VFSGIRDEGAKPIAALIGTAELSNIRNGTGEFSY